MPTSTTPSRCAADTTSAPPPQPGHRQIEGSFWRTASKVDYDGSITNHSDITQQVAGVTLTQPLHSGGKVTLRAGRAWDISDDFLGQRLHRRLRDAA